MPKRKYVSSTYLADTVTAKNRKLLRTFVQNNGKYI